MKLITLTLENFKGMRRFELAPKGQDVDVYATNGLGKTTLADAYYWLLTGKDSAGGSPDKLFPMGAPDGVEVSVFAEFQDDSGANFTIGRLLKKKIQRVKGEAEAKVRGTTTDFYINGVIKPLKEYSAFISEKFGDERTIRLLSDHSYFAGAMPWTERRDMLIHAYAPHLSDSDVIKAHPEELRALEGYIGAMKTVRELEEEQKARRRELNKKLGEIPSRIAELTRARPELPETDGLAEIPSLVSRRAKLIVSRDKLQSGGSIAEAEATVSQCQAEIARARAAYLESAMGGNEELERRCAALRDALQKSEAAQSKAERLAQSAGASIESTEAELAGLRKEFAAIRSREFPENEAVCPACGRPLPPEKLEEQKAAFNLKRAQDIEDNRARGKACKQALEDFQAILEQENRNAEQEKSRQAELHAKLEAAQTDIVTPPPFEHTEEYLSLSGKLEAARQAAQKLRDDFKPRLDQCAAELAEIDAKIETMKNHSLLKQQAEQIDARVKELQAEEKRLGIELAKTETLLSASERFVQFQADEIEERVNGAFSSVRWQMFERQVNGGISPCCKATVGGVPYETGTNALNTAAKVNAGLDIIGAMARSLGYTLPVWIDNAESVVEYLPISSQMIRLRVSEADQEIRVAANLRRENHEC